jgi:hypothetical protein
MYSENSVKLPAMDNEFSHTYALWSGTRKRKQKPKDSPRVVDAPPTLYVFINLDAVLYVSTMVLSGSLGNNPSLSAILVGTRIFYKPITSEYFCCINYYLRPVFGVSNALDYSSYFHEFRGMTVGPPYSYYEAYCPPEVCVPP